MPKTKILGDTIYFLKDILNKLLHMVNHLVLKCYHKSAAVLSISDILEEVQLASDSASTVSLLFNS